MSVGKHGIMPQSRNVRPNEFAQANGGDAIWTIPAGQLGVTLSGIEWSYSAAPANGRILIRVNGADVINIDVTAAGADDIDYTPALRFESRQAVDLVLLNGGVGIVGKIRPKAYWYE